MSDLIYRNDAIEVFGDVHPLDYNAMTYINKIKNIPAIMDKKTVVPKDYLYDTETAEFYVYRHKYTGHEIHVEKPTPIYKIDKVLSVISHIEEVRDKDKNAGEYPYNRCIEIVKEVFGDDK